MKKTDGVKQHKDRPMKNKGEVSELYVFLTSLRDGRIYTANEDLDIIHDIYYTIRTVIRGQGKQGDRAYVITSEGGPVEIYRGEEYLDSVSHEDVVDDARQVLDELEK